MSSAKTTGRPAPSLIQTLRAFEAIFNNFRYYTEMSCYLVPAETPEEWNTLQSDLKHFHIKDFESLFNKNEERHLYNLAQFKRLMKEKRPLCTMFSGFHDYFVPVLKAGQCVAFLVSGVFLKGIPTRKDLEHQWELWSGRKPVSDDVDFKRFVSIALSTPLLDGPQASSHLELLEMAASLISGKGEPDDIAARATQLNHKIFAKWKLDVRWPWRALGLETGGANRVWPDRRLNGLDRIVTKMKRVPRAAIALLLADPYNRSLGEVDSIIRQKRLERAGFLFAQTLGETVAFPLWDEGLVFLTSPRPVASPIQARLQLRETTRLISERMGGLFGTQAYTGIGSIVPEGDGLYPSFREAYQALRWAVHRNRKLLFYSEIGQPESKSTAKDRPWPESTRLVEACLKGLKTEESSALDDYLKNVFRHAAERPDLVRVHLMDTLTLYAASLEKELFLPTGRLSGFLKEWVLRFEMLRSAREMGTAFKEAIQSFKEFSLRPSAVEGKSAIMELKAYVEEHFRSSLSTHKVARQMGISRSTLHRYVRKWIGKSFHEYVQEIRLEEAKHMLLGSRSSVVRIARECGFSSSGYFIRVFKKWTEKTPQQYRKHPGSRKRKTLGAIRLSDSRV